MASVDVPLTLHTALTSWRADPTTLVLAILAAGTYWLSWRRSSLPRSRGWWCSAPRVWCG
ncbi:hypothetical protein LK461_06950 [Gordonia bronchialis]|nr:hypothetical protein [Gordonia bronchialis]MCC3322677.1 hypothetical protein [Gordonia bronchialis]